MQGIHTLLLPEVRAPGDTFGKVTALRALRKSAGRSPWGSFAAHAQQEEGTELVALDRFPRSLSCAEAVREDALLLVDLPHPNLIMVRDVIADDEAVIVVSDFVDGERLDDVRRGKDPVSLEIGLRVLVDVLAALSALHGVKKGLLHGHVSAANVIVGLDGIGRLARGFMGRAGADLVDSPSLGYVAPEILRGDEGVDPRADVYSAGVLLWETIAQKRLFPGATKQALLNALTKPRPKAVASATWAAPLAEVAHKAMSADPGGRYATTAEMAAAVRLIVRAKLATPQKVSSFATSVAGTRVQARRGELAVPAELRPRVSRPEMSPASMRALDGMRPPSKPPRGTPSAPPVAVLPPPPASPSIEPAIEPEPISLEPEPISLEPEPEPISLEPEPKPEARASEPPVIVAPPDEREERAAPTQRKPRTASRARGVLLLLLGVALATLVVAGVTIARHKDAPPASSAPLTTAPVTPSATAPTVKSSAPAPKESATESAPAPTESASAPTESAPSASATSPRGSPTKPKSTYDPQGI